jgi:dihydrofolate reductase
MTLIAACAISLNGCLGTHPHQFASLLEGTPDKAADLDWLTQLRSGMKGIIMGHNTFKAFPKVHPVVHDRPLIHVILTRSGQVDTTLPLFQQTKHPVWVASDKPVTTGTAINHSYRTIPDLMQQLPAGEWLVEGGGQIVQAFLPYLQTIYLTVCPVWLPNGIPLFQHDWTHAGNWQLQSVHPFQHAAVLKYNIQTETL